ncbi:hypothetical protein ACFL5V_14035, partial [Fibrobacterota bacterium]
MRNLFAMLAGALGMGLMGCASFPEKYENVIEDQKIRPLALLVDRPDAAPGDTLTVDLKLHDAGIDYTIDWELALNYSVTNYGQLGEASIVLDLDSMGLAPVSANADQDLQFRFVIPTGEHNPILLSSLVPEVLVPAEDLTSQQRDDLDNLGIPVSARGLETSDVVDALDIYPQIPNELAPMVDEMLGLVVVTAKINSPRFKLDVTKRISI